MNLKPVSVSNISTPKEAAILFASDVDTMDFTAAPFLGSVPCFCLVERM